MKKEPYAAPSVELIEVSNIDVLKVSTGENEIVVGDGSSFF